MKITIHNITFDNMFSYGEGNSLSLDKHAVVQLVGNNGAGKSSIPLILEELLYNKNSKGIKKSEILNRYNGASHYSGSVTFSKGTDEYKLTKVVKSSAKVVLTENGKDISGHTASQTYKLVEEILGLDFKTFSKLVYQSVKSAMDFLEATDANRKKFLMSLLDLEEYAEVLEKVKALDKEESNNYKFHQGRLEAAETFISSLPKDLSLKEEVAVPDVDDETLVSKAAELRSAYKDQEEIRKRNEERARVHNQKLKLKNVELELEPISVPKEDASTLLDRARSEIFSIKKELLELSKIHANCPTCGQPIEDHQGVDGKIEKLKASLPKLEKDVVYYSDILSKYSKNEAAQKKFDQYQQEVKRLTDLAKSLGFPEVEAEDASSLLVEAEALMAEYKKQKSDKEAAEAFNKQVIAHNAKVETLTTKLEEQKKIRAQAAKDLKDSEKALSCIKVLLDAFGPKGIVQYKIESNIKAFEQLINDYLSKLSKGVFAISFSIEDSKLAINVYQEGIQIDINSASSGEFNMINTATLLAVRTLMAAISKSSINVLFLDEVISVLDEDARTLLIDILLEEKDLNSIAVSHGFSHPLAHTVEVTKENKESCVTE